VASRLQIDAAAIEAYEAMTDVGGWGNAPWRNLWRDFTAAAARVGLSHVRPYDLRHARGALLYAAGQDLAAVSRLLLHASLSTTRRYAAAAADVDAKVVAKVAAILRGDSAQPDR
jgi:integrase